MNESDRLITAVMSGAVSAIAVTPDGVVSEGLPSGLMVLPGAFNPLHFGHEGMLKAAVGITGGPGAFELSVVNVDKPELPEADVRERLSQFAGRYTALVSRAPTFLEKSRFMPGTTFVNGYDTAVRLFDDRYYPEYQPETDPDKTGSATLTAMSEIRRNDCGFIVAGRVTDGGFKTVRDIEVPEGYESMLQEIPTDVFREDVSSTEIREANETD
jgi:hypothetical protein